MTPYPLQATPGKISFVPENVDTISFYVEIYNTLKILGDTGEYLISYYIEEENSRKKVRENIRFIKAKGEVVKVVLAKLNLSSIYSGNYRFVIKVNDKNNKLLAIRAFSFQRSKHPVEVNYDNLLEVAINNTFVSHMKNKDALINHLKCIQVISTGNEVIYAQNRIKADDVYDMQQFFYYFWEKRNPADPERAWKEYHAKVKHVNDRYGSIMFQGFETARGRIFLF